MIKAFLCWFLGHRWIARIERSELSSVYMDSYIGCERCGERRYLVKSGRLMTP